MPELPEVETIANGLNKRVAGDRIDSVWVGRKREPLKSSAAEKTLIGKEFTRAFEILGKRLAEAYAKASPKLKLELEKVAHSLFEGIVPAPAPCCVGFPSAKNLEDCEGNGGTWACMPNPLGQHQLP